MPLTFAVLTACVLGVWIGSSVQKVLCRSRVVWVLVMSVLVAELVALVLLRVSGSELRSVSGIVQCFLMGMVIGCGLSEPAARQAATVVSCPEDEGR